MNRRSFFARVLGLAAAPVAATAVASIPTPPKPSPTCLIYFTMNGETVRLDEEIERISIETAKRIMNAQRAGGILSRR